MKEDMHIIMLNIFVFEKVTFSFVKANIWSQLTTYSRTTYFFLFHWAAIATFLWRYVLTYMYKRLSVHVVGYDRSMSTVCF